MRGPAAFHCTTSAFPFRPILKLLTANKHEALAVSSVPVPLLGSPEHPSSEQPLSTGLKIAHVIPAVTGLFCPKRDERL